MNGQTTAVKYMKWLKDFNPVLYSAIIVMNPEIKQAFKAAGLSYLGAIDWDGILNSITDTVGKLVPIYQQKKILQTQLDLAKSGQPMMTNEQIKQAGTTHIQVDLPPEVRDEVIQTSQAARGGINWGTMAILGVAGFFVWQMMQPKRGRR